MTWEKFQEIYEEVILKYAEDLIKLQEKDNIKCLTYNHKRKKKIYDFYESKRLYIRRYFMDHEDMPMDRHKIGAVMMYAILRSNLFKVNRLIPNLPNKLLMANEYLSFYVALSIIESYMSDDAKEKPKDNVDVKLILPDTYHESNSRKSEGEVYIDNVCKALYYVKNKKYLDIFAYADILFLLEKHHDLSLILNQLQK